MGPKAGNSGSQTPQRPRRRMSLSPSPGRVSHIPRGADGQCHNATSEDHEGLTTPLVSCLLNLDSYSQSTKARPGYCRKVAWSPPSVFYHCMDELIPFSPGSRKLIKVKGDFRERIPRQTRRRIALKRTFVNIRAQLGLFHHFSGPGLAHKFSH